MCVLRNVNETTMKGGTTPPLLDIFLNRKGSDWVFCLITFWKRCTAKVLSLFTGQFLGEAFISYLLGLVLYTWMIFLLGLEQEKWWF